MEARALTTEGQAEARGKILALEAAMQAMPERQVTLELRHHFAPGLYLREMIMPKDVCLIGKIHKTEHLCILSKGEVTVVTDEGTKRLKAPAVVHSMPGVKRAIYSHEDSVWTNIHHNPDDRRDLDAIEAHYVTDTFEKFQAFADAKQLSRGK